MTTKVVVPKEREREREDRTNLESQDELHCVVAEEAVHKTSYLFMVLTIHARKLLILGENIRQGLAWRKMLHITFSCNK
ncbi:hypothetical protein EUGRSUZ_H00579 [Eucalyptus grandis]|uniref:Uncharacterized protein n=2 Tax=Eucalyptus grandis TaxID=71139 RepID=A0ACC3JLQ0_EUCGR|nr:hypothetical protein EUGRSUZ_H00579 [Eucalyptus grandis]